MMSCCGGRRNKWECQVPGILQETDWEIFVRTNELTNKKKYRPYIMCKLGWQLKYENYSIYVQTVVKSCHDIFVESSTGHTVVESRGLALGRGLKLHEPLPVPLCSKR